MSSTGTTCPTSSSSRPRRSNSRVAAREPLLSATIRIAAPAMIPKASRASGRPARGNQGQGCDPGGGACCTVTFTVMPMAFGSSVTLNRSLPM